MDRTSDSLQTSFQRLASGLRINSAKDDAAGLAIATRFTSSISGLGVAKRNANDAISLAQVAEGALDEVTTILQRCRELALQSANGSNSSEDRKALQSEVNALKSELTRIATTTTFNGNNILDGSMKNTQFQIGSEANQTVSMSIDDTRTTAIGTNEATSSNSDGIEQATYRYYFGGGISSGATALGAEVGVGQNAATNGYSGETLTVSYVNSSGVTQNSTVTVTANDDAATIASNLSALAGGSVSATAFNKVTISAVTGNDSDFGVNLHFSGSNLDSSFLAMSDTTAITFAGAGNLAATINADANLSAAGIFAVSTNNGASIDIYAMQGQDIMLEYTNGTGSYTVASAFNGGGASTVASESGSTHTRGGRVDVTMAQGYSISTSGAAGTAILGANATSGSWNGYIPGNAVGNIDISGGNSVKAQTLTVSGNTGTTTVAIAANDTASNIVTKVDSISSTTSVNTGAVTTATLSGLTQDGTVSFYLSGDNSSYITAPVKTSDLSGLMEAINNATGSTNITAALGTSNSQIVLTHSTGNDIGIKNFTHSAAVAYPNPTSQAVASDGTGFIPPVVVSLNVTGNASTNTSGQTVTLSNGGTTDMQNQDSTVIGGHLTFTSSASFTISSNVDGANGYIGSLFGVAINAGTISTELTVGTVDISTIAGANQAVSVLSDAMNQISDIRAGLGAIQSRFESTIRNLSNNIENLTLARSRILDTDFAEETANLAKNQILQQVDMADRKSVV